MKAASDPAAYFGRQVRKERTAHGWNLHEFGQLIAYHPAAISRVASWMARQQRVLLREEPPVAWFLVDYFALIRQVGPPGVMAAQLRHLTAMAALPHVTIQVVPGIAHAGLAGGFTMTDHGAYAESVTHGQVFETDETVSSLSLRFDTVRNSACSAPESSRLLKQAAQLWNGASRLTAWTTGTA
jgi:hypothetical protein